MGLFLLPKPIHAQQYSYTTDIMGSKETPCNITSVNWTNFWRLFNAHTAWDLEYNEGSGWISVKTDLQVKKQYVDHTKCKIALEFTASHTADYHLTFAIDLDVKKYVYKESDAKYVLEYKNYSVFFDFSDLKQISGLTFNHGVIDIDGEKWFWFRAKKENVKKGAHLSLDPTFGYELEGAYTLTLKDQIRGTIAWCDGGWAQSITVYLYVNVEGKFRCALYQYAPNAFVGQTEERTLSPTPWAEWFTFNFSDPLPTLQAKFHRMVVWAENTSYCYADILTAKGLNQTLTYTGNYPNELNPTINNYRHSIYCTYTKSQGWQGDGDQEEDGEQEENGIDGGVWPEEWFEPVVTIPVPPSGQIKITKLGLYVILGSVGLIAIVGMGKALSTRSPKRIRPKGTSRSTRNQFSKRRSKAKNKPFSKRKKFKKAGPKGKM